MTKISKRAPGDRDKGDVFEGKRPRETTMTEEYTRKNMHASIKSNDVRRPGPPTEIAKMLQELVEASKQESVAEKLNISQGSISRYIAEKQYPGLDIGDRIRNLHAITFSENEQIGFQKINDDVGVSLPLAGRLVFGKIGGEVLAFNHEAHDITRFIKINFPIPMSGLAFVTEGNAYYPRCQDGDVIVCGQRAGSYEEPIGWEAIVTTLGGHRFLRTVQRGSKVGLYTLESFVGPSTYDVKLQSILRVTLILPRGTWSETIPTWNEID